MTKKNENYTAYKTLTITFKNGQSIAYDGDAWGDFMYTGDTIVVVDKCGCWRSIYPFSEVFSVELS